MSNGAKFTIGIISGKGKKEQLNHVTNLEEMDEEEMLMRAIAMSLEEEKKEEEEKKSLAASKSKDQGSNLSRMIGQHFQFSGGNEEEDMLERHPSMNE